MHSTRKPRILQVITHLALGGAERVCFTLMKGLSSDVAFSVFAVRGVDQGPVGKDLMDECRRSGFGLHMGSRLPLKSGGLLAAGAALRSVLTRTHYDIVHLHTEAPELAYALSVIMRTRSNSDPPIVRTIHNSVYWTPWRPLGLWSERRMRKCTVVGVSAAALEAFDDVRRTSGAGPLERAAEVIFNGVDTSEFDHHGGPARDPSSPIRVLFAGRFEPQKGIDLLERALAETVPVGAPCDLTLCGAGRMDDIAQNLERKPPAGWTIRVIPAVPSIQPLLRASDLVIMPSRFEGFGLVAVESLLAGVPVVATSAPGLREVFPVGYPWLAIPGDAVSFGRVLQQALSSSETWARVVAQVRPEIRSRFGSDRMCVAYRDLYQSVLGQTVRKSTNEAVQAHFR